MQSEPTATGGPQPLDVCGRRRSSATFPEFHSGRPPANRGQKFPADPPTVEEIVAILRVCPDTLAGRRNRALMVLLWRTGLRVSEALDLHESDLEQREHSVFVRSGKGSKSRRVGMDDWGWDQLRPWLDARQALPVGTVFCIATGPTAGRRWASAGARAAVRKAGIAAGVRRRVHPHAFRHVHAVELAREGVPLHIIQRQLGHQNPGITAVYLTSISGVEVIDAIGARRAPMLVPALR